VPSAGRRQAREVGEEAVPFHKFSDGEDQVRRLKQKGSGSPFASPNQDGKVNLLRGLRGGKGTDDWECAGARSVRASTEGSDLDDVAGLRAARTHRRFDSTAGLFERAKARARSPSGRDVAAALR
jgi:hypothetical protein